MENVIFNVSNRTEKGSKVRRNGQIPAVLSGAHLDSPIPVTMEKSDVYKLLAYPKSTILSLKLNNDVRKCIVRELQNDIYGKTMHIDFQCIRSDENIKMRIPVEFVGQDKLGANNMSLETFISDVELFGEADKLPDEIRFDVSGLKTGDKLLAKDLSIPEGIKLDGDKEKEIAKVCGMIPEADEENEEA